MDNAGLQSRQILEKLRVGPLHSPQESANRARQETCIAPRTIGVGKLDGFMRGVRPKLGSSIRGASSGAFSLFESALVDLIQIEAKVIRQARDERRLPASIETVNA
jgi:hypothetical protein